MRSEALRWKTLRDEEAGCIDLRTEMYVAPAHTARIRKEPYFTLLSEDHLCSASRHATAAIQPHVRASNN